jgi:hypothetical protein
MYETFKIQGTSFTLRHSRPVGGPSTWFRVPCPKAWGTELYGAFHTLLLWTSSAACKHILSLIGDISRTGHESLDSSCDRFIPRRKSPRYTIERWLLGGAGRGAEKKYPSHLRKRNPRRNHLMISLPRLITFNSSKIVQLLFHLRDKIAMWFITDKSYFMYRQKHGLRIHKVMRWDAPLFNANFSLSICFLY